MIDASATAVLGTPGEDVTHWGIARRAGGKWVMLDFPDDMGTRLKHWPLSTCSVDVIRERWGSGEFRVVWLVLDPDHPQPEQRQRSGGNGRQFVLDSMPAPVHVAAPAVATRAPSGFEEAAAIMRFADDRTASQLAMVATLAQTFAGANAGRGGLGAAELELILTRQTAQFQALVSGLDARHAETTAALRSEIAASRGAARDDREDRGPAAFEPGDSLWDSVKAALANAALSNPGKVLEAVTAIPKILEGVTGTLNAANAAKVAAANPSPPEAPRPRLVRAAPPPSPSPPPGPGLNGYVGEAPPPAPATPWDQPAGQGPS